MIRNWMSVAAVCLLVGCAGPQTISPPCCYNGSVTSARFNELYLETRDGERLAFQDVFASFAPTGWVGPTFPFHQDITIREVVYEPLSQVLPTYDANQNNQLEVPEATVLYLQEAARGLGYDVVAIGTNPRVEALAASTSDIGGLLRFIQTERARLSPRARHIFRDLEAVGLDQQLDSPGPDDSFVPPRG
ncbi:MAG: hypothetical protein AAF493_06665 [Pseudomonadota bacterium]